MTRMTTDVEALSQLVQTGPDQRRGRACSPASACSCSWSSCRRRWPWPPPSVLPPLFIATWWYRRRSTVAYAAARESIADVNANLQESLSGVRVAQAYVREDRNIAGFHDVNRRVPRPTGSAPSG